MPNRPLIRPASPLPLTLMLLCGLHTSASALPEADAPSAASTAVQESALTSPTADLAADLAAGLQAMLAQPREFDYGSFHQQFITTADLAESQNAYAVLNHFEDAFAPTEAECAQHGEALRAALQQVPVSIALHLLSAGCSSDDQVALAHLAALRGLLGMGSHPLLGSAPQIPYRVFARPDAEVLPGILGLDLLAMGWNGADTGTLETLPMSLLVRERDQPEAPTRFLHVDNFDTVARMAEIASAPAHPLLRFQLLVEYMASGIHPGQPFDPLTRVADALSDLAAEDIDAASARTAILEVREFDPAAVANWVYLCQIDASIEPCPAEDLDLLLDDAESGHPLALSTLALAHLTGRQVAVDAARAEAFLDLLLSRHEREEALAMTAQMLLPLLQAAGEKRSPALDGFLRRLLADLEALPAERPRGRAMLGVLALAVEPAERREAESRRWFAQAAEAGWAPALLVAVDLGEPEARQRFIAQTESQLQHWALPQARLLLARALFLEGRDAEAQVHLERAARAGLPAALREYVERVLLEAGTPEQVELAEDVLQVLIMMQDLRALPMLFAARLDHPEPAREPLSPALLEMLTQSVRESDHPALRLLLGKALFEGVAGPADRKEGLRQVRRAQREGWAWAYLYEHELQQSGRLGKARPRDMDKLLRKALDAAGQSRAVKAEVAQRWLLDPATSADRVSAAMTLLAQAEQPGSYLQNDIAWVLCLEDQAQRGLPLAEAAVAHERSASTVDTLAACHAAVGDFEQAVSLQREALQRVDEEPDHPAEAVPGMQHRMQAYSEGRADFGE